MKLKDKKPGNTWKYFEARAINFIHNHGGEGYSEYFYKWLISHFMSMKSLKY